MRACRPRNNYVGTRELFQHPAKGGGTHHHLSLGWVWWTGLVLYPRSADQEISPKTYSREGGNAEHHLLMPAHPCLCFADRQGAHNCHRGLLLVQIMKRRW